MIHPVHATLGAELRQTLRAHERALGLSCCLRAMDDPWRRRFRAVGLPGAMALHLTPFCWAKKEADPAACKDSCSRVCAGECIGREGPFLRRCHADANEFVVPLLDAGALVAMLHVGPFRCAAGQPQTLTLWTGPRIRSATVLLRSLQCWLLDFFHRLRLAEASQPSGEQARIEAFLDAHLEADADLTALANHLHVSTSWAAVLVRRALGCGFRTAKERRRLQVARQLLAVSDCSVAVVARRVGLEDADYFCRYFKAKTGSTPSGYRRDHARTHSV